MPVKAWDRMTGRQVNILTCWIIMHPKHLRSHVLWMRIFPFCSGKDLIQLGNLSVYLKQSLYSYLICEAREIQWEFDSANELLHHVHRCNALQIVRVRQQSCSQSLLRCLEVTHFMQNVLVLDLEGARIGCSGVEKLSLCFPSLSCCRILNLSWNGIRDCGLKSLGLMLEKHQALRHLDLSFNLFEDGFADFCGSLQKTPSKIELLYLEANRIGDKGAIKFAEVLEFQPKMRDLNLAICHIGAMGVTAISTALHYSSEIADLNMCWNNIQDKGLDALLEAIREHCACRQLVRLNLCFTGVTSDGVCNLAGHLKYLPKLTALNLSLNRLDSEGVVSLAGHWHQVPLLQELNLAANLIDRTGVIALCESIGDVPMLSPRHLNLSGNRIRQSEVSQLLNQPPWQGK